MEAEKPPGFIDRYFARYVHPGESLYYYQHSNGLVVTGLLRGHPALASSPTRVRFLLSPPRDGEKHRALGNLVSGKRKRGGVVVQPRQRLCEVESSGQIFEVRSAVRGTIIEINERLLSGELDVLIEDPEEAGFLFIINPFHGDELLGATHPELVSAGGKQPWARAAAD